MSWDQLRAVTRVATPDTDDELAAEAPNTPVRDLNRFAREIRLRDVEEVHRDPPRLLGAEVVESKSDDIILPETTW